MRAVRRTALAVSLVALVMLPVAVAAGSTSHTKKVTVADDYYAPTKVTVTKGTKIEWVWPEGNVDNHDVKLEKGPHGAKKFHSPQAAQDFTYTRTLTVPGTYEIVCTLHQDMTMKIVVKK